MRVRMENDRGLTCVYRTDVLVGTRTFRREKRSISLPISRYRTDYPSKYVRLTILQSHTFVWDVHILPNCTIRSFVAVSVWGDARIEERNRKVSAHRQRCTMLGKSLV